MKSRHNDPNFVVLRKGIINSDAWCDVSCPSGTFQERGEIHCGAVSYFQHRLKFPLYRNLAKKPMATAHDIAIRGLI